VDAVFSVFILLNLMAASNPRPDYHSILCVLRATFLAAETKLIHQKITAGRHAKQKTN